MDQDGVCGGYPQRKLEGWNRERGDLAGRHRKVRDPDGWGVAKIPYVGCGVLASAVSMDKLFTKIIVDNLGVRQAEYEPVTREQLAHMEAVTARIEGHFSYPVFIKPSNAGSSRGVSKAENREELEAGLLEAARHDRKILVEEAIVGREVECAVFGGGAEAVVASGVGEILAAAEFYDFEAKYYN